jgi:hypothetical protein
MTPEQFRQITELILTALEKGFAGHIPSALFWGIVGPMGTAIAGLAAWVAMLGKAHRKEVTEREAAHRAEVANRSETFNGILKSKDELIAGVQKEARDILMSTLKDMAARDDKFRAELTALINETNATIGGMNDD